MAYTCALFDNNYIKYYSSTVINSPYKFQTDARINRGIECNIISFEITEMNGRPVEKMISIDLVYKFWAAFGFSNEVLLEKEAQMMDGKIRLIYRTRISIPSICICSESFHFLEVIPEMPPATDFTAKLFKCRRVICQHGISIPNVSDEALVFRPPSDSDE